jgi:hypoxanthine phosphoribosyltransferase
MPDLTPVLKKERIDAQIRAVARRISTDYQTRDLILIGVLKGAFIFLADLIRQLSIPAKVDFVRVSSYGAGTSSSGKIKLTKEIETDVKGRDVLIVEDIVDTGLSLVYLIDYLTALGAGSVKICTMIDKRERRQVSVDVAYACHVVNEGFLVGFGLDFNEDYRGLPEIYHLNPN